MTIVTESRHDVHSACALPSEKAWPLCRHMDLPVGSTLAKVVAIREHFDRFVGRELDVWDAIRILDRLEQERGGVPFPREYARVADMLLREGYAPDDVHAAIGHLRRGGSVATCPALTWRDRPAVTSLIPKSGRSPGGPD
jgi:hypothetical protein